MHIPVSPESKNAWAAFLNDVTNMRRKLNCYGAADSDEAWFRGHVGEITNSYPSLFRPFERRDDEVVWSAIWGNEADLFWEFWARAKELHGVIEDDWDVLFAMQHYGTPTRLLDWTEVLGVAVYFATLGVEENNPKGATAPCILLQGGDQLRRSFDHRLLNHPGATGLLVVSGLRARITAAVSAKCARRFRLYRPADPPAAAAPRSRQR